MKLKINACAEVNHGGERYVVSNIDQTVKFQIMSGISCLVSLLEQPASSFPKILSPMASPASAM